MKIIDLSMKISNDLEVYPGDPDVNISVIATIPKTGFEMRRIEMNGHDGTHVNAQNHCLENGVSIDNYLIEEFIGECVLYENNDDICSKKGILFDSINIDEKIKNIILTIKPKFVCLSSKFVFDEEVEKELVKANIICFENIYNCEKLPKNFQFFGVPLNIKGGDGSPVRAFAIIN